jgi:aromatic-L-amino-acid/L-tryptophan decarboxylase
LLDAVNGSGHSLVTHTRLDGRLVVRVSIGGIATGPAHVDRLWAELERAAR